MVHGGGQVKPASRGVAAIRTIRSTLTDLPCNQIHANKGARKLCNAKTYIPPLEHYSRRFYNLLCPT